MTPVATLDWSTVPSLPPGVSYTWERVSRRQAELKVYDGKNLIFHAMTDGRRWSSHDVLELLRGRLDPAGMGE